MLNVLRLSLRQFTKAPGFTATALATLAICLAVNLTIFAVVDAVLLRSLPFANADRLVTVFNSYPGAGVERGSASIPNYYDRRGAIKAFASVSIYNPGSTIVGEKGSPRRVDIMRVSPEFFATLGVPLLKGRAFSEAQLAYGPDEVAVLTYGFWRDFFAGDPNVLGRTFVNDGLTITVIGVLPADFHFLSSRALFYRPLSHAPEDRLPANRHNNGPSMVALLAPGATVAQAQAQINAFNAVQLKDDPLAAVIKGAAYHTNVRLLREDYVREVRPTLLLLQAGAFLLLVTGGVNLANLLLIRATGRTKELAVRQALGAGRYHVVRDVAAEMLVLGLGGGILGLILASFGIDLLRLLGTDKIPLGASVELDGRVAAVSLLAALLAGLVLAVPIAWYHLRAGLTLGLQADSRGGTSGRGIQRLRRVFIVAQVALAFVLLFCAGLMAVSLRRVLETPAGFRTDNVLTGNIALPWKGYKDDASRFALVQRLLPAVRALPGVTHAAISTNLPFNAFNVNDSVVAVEGYAKRPGENMRAHYISDTMGDYWPVLRIPLRRGRLLDDADNLKKRMVCVVDQAFADRYWPGQDPLGRRIARDIEVKKDNALEVVGVVANVKQHDLTEEVDHGSVYVPYALASQTNFTLAVQTTLPPAALIPELQKAILGLDPNLPIDDLKPMQARLDDTLVARRSPAIMAAGFAGVALLLSALGTYGVLSFAVAQRRREIGVRMAVGAPASTIRGQFLSEGLRLAAIGIALGLAGAWASAHAMQALLFGVSALHLPTLAAAAAVIGAVSTVACLLPAVQASRISPIEALRDE